MTVDSTFAAPGNSPAPRACDDLRSTRLYLLRHGEVDGHWRDRIYGRLDVPLSTRGHEQCARIAEAFRGRTLRAVISSGLARAEAAALALRAERPELARRDEPDLVELDRGPWAGRSKSELRASEPAGFERWERSRGVLGPPGSETLEELAARVVPRVTSLAREFEGGAIAVVAHLWVTRAAVCAALGLPVARAAQIALPPGGCAVIDWPSGRTPELISLGPGLPLP